MSFVDAKAELAAMAVIQQAMEPLSIDERKRVLDWTKDRYEIYGDFLKISGALVTQIRDAAEAVMEDGEPFDAAKQARLTAALESVDSAFKLRRPKASAS